jgi:preprotein translocase subunit SecD/SecD/SecF fusion protein
MTSLDADAVQMVAALALFFVAVGSVKGFGLTLALGILCDIATMFCFKAPLLRLLALKTISDHPKFWGVDQDLAEAGKPADAEAEKGGVANA